MAEGRAWEGEIEIHGAAGNSPVPDLRAAGSGAPTRWPARADSAIAMYERYVNTPWQRRYETDGIEPARR